MNRHLFCLAFMGVLGLLLLPCPSASAVDVDLRIGSDRPRPVVIQPPPTVGRRWVPDQVVRREEQVMVERSRVELREERILVQPARIEQREEQVLVREAHIERRWVETERRDSLRIGPVRLESRAPTGHWEEVMIPAQYQTVVREYTVPARYKTVVREVRIPARYEVVSRDVVIPGHWEELAYEPPPVIVVPERHSGIELDIDLHKDRDHERHRH